MLMPSSTYDPSEEISEESSSLPDPERSSLMSKRVIQRGHCENMSRIEGKEFYFLEPSALLLISFSLKTPQILQISCSSFELTFNDIQEYFRDSSNKECSVIHDQIGITELVQNLPLNSFDSNFVHIFLLYSGLIITIIHSASDLYMGQRYSSIFSQTIRYCSFLS